MKRPSFNKGYSFASDESLPLKRRCEYINCSEEALYRAPKTRHNLHDYHWFCLSHVRDYNKKWDYYKGMNSKEIDASRIDDITWNRPSWPLGNRYHTIKNMSGLNEFEHFLHSWQSKHQAFPSNIPESCKTALRELEMELPLTFEDLKIQYKKLVKRHHPDKHKGDKLAEEKLKKINHAYTTLKSYLSL